MSDDSAHSLARAHGWRNVGMIHLGKQDGCEQLAAEQVQQALQPLRLPNRLLEKLQASVYNAVARIYAAHDEGVLTVRLLIAEHTWQQGLSSGAAPGEPLVDASEPGWGFFLIERRGPTAPSAGAAHHLVELYCYQEGEQSGLADH
ncbi:MAG: hypothetical protein KJZ93_20980 [Caldilineaceae bacterium]|nr:hypothetical protein [Caldilineaceae bacterium]